MEPNAAFAKALKRRRLIQKLSQLELAQLTGLNRTFISMLERGERQPSLTTLVSISAAFDMLPSEFMIEIERLLKLRKARGGLIASRRL